MSNRPELSTNLSIDDFKSYYWLKEELTAFCKKSGLDCSGGKIEMAKRIETFLATGIVPKKHPKETKRSNFDWNTERLCLSTVITDNYRNTQNVRDFFSKHAGRRFSFNVRFIEWMKKNEGKTLQDAMAAWEKIREEKSGRPKEIAPQFEYNTYIRDFLADNPDKTLRDAIRYWKRKRNAKGTRAYHRTDFELQ
jgi:hypothetical protein